VLPFVFLLLLQLPPPAGAQYEDIYDRSVPSIVLIRGPLLTRAVAQGTGFIVGHSGYILTNHHVIEGMTDIRVTLNDFLSRRTVQARLLGYIREVLYGNSVMGSLPDKIVDLAVLKVDAGELSALPLGDSNQLREGQEIIVLGFPGHVPTDRVSIVRGIISAVHEGWVQTDAAFDSGNSGGPVLDRDGRVVGLATFITGAHGKLQGFVPINRVNELTSGVASGHQFKEKFWISGMEYVPSIKVGRRVTYSETYWPARPTGQGSVTTITTEVTSLTSAFGAYRYTIRDSNGTVSTNYLSSDGLVSVKLANDACTTQFDDNAYVIPLPIVTGMIGASWKFGARTRCSSGETTEATTTYAVKSIDETLPLSTGRFTGVLHLVGTYEATRTANGQPRHVVDGIDVFRAPGRRGDVWTVTTDRETGDMWTKLLLRVDEP